jgi:hypothetical protein
LVLSAIALAGNVNAVAIALRLVAWPFVVLFLLLAARLLRGKASYTRTFRVTGFAYFAYWLTVLYFVPVAGPLFRTIGFLLGFLGIWLGTAQAHELRGWRTLLLPIVFLVVTIVVGSVLRVLLGGAALTIDTIMQDSGL